MVTLRKIAFAFTRYANLTFGGGSATIAILHRETVERRKWINQDRFNLVFALARLTPGTNLLAFCAGIGWFLRRTPGAVVALLAASVPCAVIVVAVTMLFDKWSHNPTAELAIKGATAAAVGITAITCWTIAKPYFKGRSWFRSALIGSAAFAVALLFDVPAVRVLLIAGALGALVPERRP